MNELIENGGLAARPASAMSYPRNIPILMLAALAGVLITLLVCTHRTSEARAQVPILADSLTIVTGSYSSDIDLIYVLDNATRRLNVYTPNSQAGSIDLVDSLDVESGFAQQ